MDNLQWLQKTALIQSKEWHDEKVIRIEEIEDYKFYDTQNIYRNIINPQKIKGIDYAYSYNCF